MANYEHSVCEPSDEERVFDDFEEDDDIEGSRLPLLIVLALLVLAMFAGVVWLAYTQGVTRGRGETPVLTAAAGPEWVVSPGGDGGNIPYQGFKIYDQPAPSDRGTAGAPPAPAAAQAPKPAPVTRAPALLASASHMPAKPVPAAAAPIEAATPPPAASPSKAVSPKAAATLTLALAKPGTGYVLQIGAYTSQRDADVGWRAYKARHAALLSGYSDDVQQADLGPKGMWYRLRVGGLTDKNAATALCDKLKADGGACILGR